MWISRKKLNELRNIVLNHERDLKEQLEINRRIQNQINKLQGSESTVRYGYVDKHGDKYLILSVWEFGKPIWSKHFKIAGVDSEEGIRNDHYDKRVDEFLKSSSR